MSRRVPQEPAFAHSLGACGFSLFYPTCSVETVSGVSMRGEGRKRFFPLVLLKTGASSVSKSWSSSGLLPLAEPLCSGLLPGPSSFTFSAFAMVPAAASVLSA